MKFVLKALASTVVAGTALLAGAPSALAAARHVGVVVRYADGRVSAGCTTAGGSGLQVLERKHSVTMGTQQYSGFVLRIDGNGTSRPDNTHYWSYWHSSGHGGWTYASSGAASYTPRAGTVEGWSFVNGQNSAPRPPSYTYAALCGSLDPKPRPAPTPKSSPTPVTHSTTRSVPMHRPTVQPPASSAPAGPATTSAPDMAPPTQPHRHASRRARPTAPAARTASTTKPRPTPSATRTTATKAAAAKTAPTSAAPSPVAQRVDNSSSAAWPTIGALVVIAALGMTAWLVARRRTG